MTGGWTFSFRDLVVLQGHRVFLRCTEAEGALGGDGEACTMTVMVKRTRQNQNYATDWWILTFLAFQLARRVYGLPPIYRVRRSPGGDDGSTS